MNERQLWLFLPQISSMALLLVCIICNVLLAVIFKYFDHWKVDNLNAIIVNYIVCVIGGSIALGKFIIPSDLTAQAWFPYSIMLALLFIVGFNLMGYSFQKAGVALTAIVAKMSLILSAGFPILFYGEPYSISKILGILAGIVAIILVNLPDKDEQQEMKIGTWLIIIPLLVWLMSGAIEILLFYVQVENYVSNDSMIFVCSSFGIAGLMGLIYSIYRSVSAKIFIQTRDVIGGVILGVPNFFTIFLLLYLLEQGWQGSNLFPLNNISILLLTALVGWWFFKEKMSMPRIVGMVLSLIAIVLISANVF